MTVKIEEEKKFVVRCDSECSCIRCIILKPKLSPLDVRELIYSLQNALFDYAKEVG